MKVNVSVCTGCGGPLPVVEHQFVTNCLYCDSRYYVRQDMPPAVVINPGIEKETARDLVLNELHSKEIDADFIKRSASEGVTLYYIPFFEVRGLKAGLQQSTDPGKQVEFSYQAYERIEKGNDLNDMALDFFDDAIVQEAIVNADTTTFNPVELRKKGVVLSPQGVELFKKNENPNALESVENYYRIVYFPVWEVGYSYKGILFKSHVSAVDGKIIKIQGLRCHKKKMLKAMGGLLALGILLGRGINGGAAPLFIALLIGLPAAIILTPYFWELFAFQEIAEKRGEGEFLFKAINYTENSFIQFSRKIMSTFENLVGEARDDEPFD